VAASAVSVVAVTGAVVQAVLRVGVATGAQGVDLIPGVAGAEGVEGGLTEGWASSGWAVETAVLLAVLRAVLTALMTCSMMLRAAAANG
jgi:hypothetical protein